MTEQGMIQQSHSKSPQSQGIQGFVGPLMPFVMLEVDDVEGGILDWMCCSGSVSVAIARAPTSTYCLAAASCFGY
jgi:hypothetical protein